MKKLLSIFTLLFVFNLSNINAQSRKLDENKSILIKILDLLFCRSERHERHFDFAELEFSDSGESTSDEMIKIEDTYEVKALEPDTSSDKLIAKILSGDDLGGLSEQEYLDDVSNVFEDIPVEFVGFNSSDNTCYANASLQLLINAPGFRCFLNNENGFLDEESFVLQDLRRLYSAYTCDEPYCSNDARLGIIKSVIGFNDVDDDIFIEEGQLIQFGRFSSPNIFFDLLFEKLIPSAQIYSLKDIFRLFNVEVLDSENTADAVILHVNDNHYSVKFRIGENWTLVDEKQVIPNMTNEQINAKYSTVVPVFSVKYL